MLLAAAVPVVLLAVAAGLTAALVEMRSIVVAGWIVVAIAVGFLAVLAWLARTPRRALAADKLLVYLRLGPPIQVPLEVIECFLMGQGPAWLPLGGEQQTVTLVIRLREKAQEWSHLEVDPRLGSWCDSHVTVRGTWCEPLSVNKVNDLNARLDAAQRAAQGLPARTP